MEQMDIDDERHAKLFEEIRNCLDPDETEEVFFFDHIGGEYSDIHTRTAVMKWQSDQYLIIQTHYWHDESEPAVVRLPLSAIKFMCADILERSISTQGYRIGQEGVTQLNFTGWK